MLGFIIQMFSNRREEPKNEQSTFQQNKLILTCQHTKNLQYVELIGLAYELNNKKKFKKAEIALLVKP